MSGWDSGRARVRPVVAIDGPAGAGKSTVARLLARKLGFTLIDTGALYRSVALAVRRAGLAWTDSQAISELAHALVRERRLRLVLDERGEERVLLDGDDISDAIRTAEVSTGASRVSAIAEVRHALFALQRQAGELGGVVLEGRDIGTVVFPDAELKFFLTASVETRAKRRFEELQAKGQPVEYAATLDEVRQRDERDSTRPVSPLRQADDAVLVDSSDRAAEQIVELMAASVRARYPG